MSDFGGVGDGTPKRQNNTGRSIQVYTEQALEVGRIHQNDLNLYPTPRIPRTPRQACATTQWGVIILFSCLISFCFGLLVGSAFMGNRPIINNPQPNIDRSRTFCIGRCD